MSRRQSRESRVFKRSGSSRFLQEGTEETEKDQEGAAGGVFFDGRDF